MESRLAARSMEAENTVSIERKRYMKPVLPSDTSEPIQHEFTTQCGPFSCILAVCELNFENEFSIGFLALAIEPFDMKKSISIVGTNQYVRATRSSRCKFDNE